MVLAVNYPNFVYEAVWCQFGQYFGHIDRTMTKEEFKDARKALGMTITDLALAMRTDRRAVERYESGERDVPGPVSLLLEAMLDGWRSKRIE
jgi:predicted transcriptional regulator